MGTCNKFNGLCTCRDGFFGSACQYARCPRGTASKAGSECSGHGRCLTVGEAAQEQNHVTLLQNSYAYTHWDANRIQGCVCDPGYTSGDCSLRSCPYGDDPGSGSQVDEVQLIQCLATSGTFAITFRGHSTTAIPFNANVAALDAALEALDTVVLVTTALDGGSVVCDANGVTMRVTFTHNPGDLPPMLLSSAALSAGATLLLKENGAASTYNSGISSVRGTKDSLECSNRGACDRTTGLCTCHPKYQSSNGAGGLGTIPDCGYKSVSGAHSCLMIGALGGGECGGGMKNQVKHGTCVGGTHCTTCDSGYGPTGSGDCTLRACPYSRAWFSEATADNTAHATLECGGVGHCNRETGACECMTLGSYILSSNQLFEGAGCDKLACPYNATHKSGCGSKGTCLSMAQWAAKTTDGQGTVLGLSYSGAASTNAWDHATMQGCFCDYKGEENTPYASLMYTGKKSWGSYPLQGYDCGLASCAVGDNPDTYDGVFEVQTLVCDATSGTFTLTFRGFTTAPISYNAVAMVGNENSASSTAGTGKGESLQSKLHGIFTVHPMCYDGTCTGVNVVYSAGTSLCTSGGSNTVSLTFESEVGDVPILAATISSLVKSGGTKTVVLVEKTRGTKETSFCSDHGVCDHDTGRCLCHQGYSSSDGNGNTGLRGDCGFKTMFATVDRARGRYRGGIQSIVAQTTAFTANTEMNLNVRTNSLR